MKNKKHYRSFYWHIGWWTCWPFRALLGAVIIVMMSSCPHCWERFKRIGGHKLTQFQVDMEVPND